jgi:hypothetical protein
VQSRMLHSSRPFTSSSHCTRGKDLKVHKHLTGIRRCWQRRAESARGLTQQASTPFSLVLQVAKAAGGCQPAASEAVAGDQSLYARQPQQARNEGLLSLSTTTTASHTTYARCGYDSRMEEP